MSAFDPMGYGSPLDLQCEFHPFGFPLELRTNSDWIVRAARNSWDGMPATFREKAIELDVRVNLQGAPAAPPAYMGRNQLWAIVSDSENAAVCDHLNRFGAAWLNHATAAQTAFTSYYFLEAMANHLLTQLYVTPIHAACVGRGGRGVLLSGPSGAGKTSLAYACARAGWTYISDNESWLLRNGGRTVAGNPRRIRFCDSAAALFPELAGRKPLLSANGKMSIVCDAAMIPGLSTAFHTEVSCLVFLERGQPAGVAGISADAAATELLKFVPQYSSPISDAHRQSIESLAQVERLRLSYRELDEGRLLLETLL